MPQSGHSRALGPVLLSQGQHRHCQLRGTAGTVPQPWGMAGPCPDCWGSFTHSAATLLAVELTWELRSFDGITQRDTGLLTSKTSQSCKPTADAHLEPAPQLPPVPEGRRCPRAPWHRRGGGLGSPEASSGLGRP